MATLDKSTTSNDDNQGSEVLQCLQDASAQLQQALNRQLQMPNHADDDDGNKEEAAAAAAAAATADLSSSSLLSSDDPDAMAAAFMAQHAQQQQAQMRLPVDEWAQVILRKQQHHHQQQVSATEYWKDPCELVRSTCRQWIQQDDKNIENSLVTINHDQIPALADEVKKHATITWDADDWHYSGQGFGGTDLDKQERVALYILALDAINFCFWPVENDNNSINSSNNEVEDNPLEYEQLAKALKSMAEADHNNRDDNDQCVFSPQNLSTMTPFKMKDLFAQHLNVAKYPIPNVDKRAELWKELGDGLIRDYQGSALQLVETAQGNAPRLVELIVTSFPGFRDEAYYRNKRLVFLKRAQILVGDINAALNLNLKGMERLTTFADYRVPQLLRHWQVLEYASSLAHLVDQRVELMAGSIEELSIRAATVVAVEELVNYLNETAPQESKDQNAPTAYTDVQVDWYLWQVGEQLHAKGALKPFHTVRTHFY
jgi:Potential Queuosine, Q, salvage protein family